MEDTYKKNKGFFKKLKFIIKSAILWFDSDADRGERYDKEDFYKLDIIRFLPFLGMHLAVVLVFWSGWSYFAVASAIIFYFLRMFIITGFYHRYFSHKTFKMNRFWQFVFALVGCACVQRGALWWAAHHRYHHRYSDTENDFHSPKKGFWWSHMFWISSSGAFRTKYELVQDFKKYPELMFLNRFDNLVPFVGGIAVYGLGVFLESFFPQLGTNGFQLFIWVGIISTVLLFHGTVTINSLSHVWGKRRFKTNDDSRNNFFLSLITLGEGWHNNHHYYPGTARQGFYWWEIDITYYGLKFLETLGIIKDLKPVPQKIYEVAKEQKVERIKKKELNLTR